MEWGGSPGAGRQVIRFNEAIDQALAESMERYAVDKEEATRRFDTLLSSSPGLQYILAVDGRLICANKAFLQLREPSAQLSVRDNIARFCPAIGAQLAGELSSVIASRAPCSGEISCAPAAGPALTYRYALMPVLNDAGQVESITGTARNISDEVHVSDSIGVTPYPQAASSPGGLVRNADQAMYVAQQAGRNRFSFFTVAMRDSAWVCLQIIDELRHALAKEQLKVLCQPIVHLETGVIAKAEALARWHAGIICGMAWYCRGNSSGLPRKPD